MFRTFALLAFAFTLASVLTPSRPLVSYRGYQVLDVEPRTEQQLKALKSLESDAEADFWQHPGLNSSTHLMIGPESLARVTGYLKHLGLKFNTVVQDFEIELNKLDEDLNNRTVFNDGDHPSQITLDEYHNFSEIMAYVTAVANTYPNITELLPVGNGSSHEGRNLTVIKITNPGNPGHVKPAVWIDGTIHAREWVTAAGMVYIINELVTKQKQHSHLLDALDIYIMPVANPDGYDYTWTTDRMWRKTRSGPIDGCYGVDPNRNFDFRFGGVGTSNNSCSGVYHGPKAFSEIETLSIRDTLKSLGSRLKSYFNVHSFSAIWIWPYVKTASERDQLAAISDDASRAILLLNGTWYDPRELSGCDGNAIDYALNVLGIKYTFGIEMRPKAYEGSPGFKLPAKQIKIAAAEAWAGIKVVFDRVAFDEPQQKQ